MIGIFVGFVFGMFQSIYNNKKIDENFKKLELEYKERNRKIE
jgi:hypothetical protein